jgi:hypothetical protein
MEGNSMNFKELFIFAISFAFVAYFTSFAESSVGSSHSSILSSTPQFEQLAKRGGRDGRIKVEDSGSHRSGGHHSGFDDSGHHSGFDDSGHHSEFFDDSDQFGFDDSGNQFEFDDSGHHSGFDDSGHRGGRGRR